jgi:hypothetical protein
MADDAALVFLAAYTTKTATFNTDSLPLLAPNSPHNLMWAHILYKAASEASGSHTVTFETQHSDDDNTFYTNFSGESKVITLTTDAVAGELWLPIMTDFATPHVRVTCTISAGGGSPTIAWGAYFSKCGPPK